MPGGRFRAGREGKFFLALPRLFNAAMKKAGIEVIPEGKKHPIPALPLRESQASPKRPLAMREQTSY